MNETLLFIKGFSPYLIIYLLTFISIFATIIFFLSSWLSNKDKIDFLIRKKEVEEKIENIKEIKDFIKEKEILDWINKESEDKYNRLEELNHLKEISPSMTKKYFKKGVLSLFFAILFVSIGSSLYSSDIKTHQPSVFYNQYNNMENIDNDNFSIKIEPHTDYKKITIIDKEQRMEYFYIVENSGDNIKNIYYSQSVIIPQLLKNIFAICYILIVAFVSYLFKITT